MSQMGQERRFAMLAPYQLIRSSRPKKPTRHIIRASSQHSAKLLQSSTGFASCDVLRASPDISPPKFAERGRRTQLNLGSGPGCKDSAVAIRKCLCSPRVSGKVRIMAALSQLPRLRIKQRAEKDSRQIRGLAYVGGIS